MHICKPVPGAPCGAVWSAELNVGSVIKKAFELVKAGRVFGV
jgi:hypothetical protein